MIDAEFKERFVTALERIADAIEGTTDDDGLLHVLLRLPDMDEPEETEEPEDDRS